MTTSSTKLTEEKEIPKPYLPKNPKQITLEELNPIEVVVLFTMLKD